MLDAEGFNGVLDACVKTEKLCTLLPAVVPQLQIEAYPNYTPEVRVSHCARDMCLCLNVCVSNTPCRHTLICM
jgi:hypothetical protein